MSKSKPAAVDLTGRSDGNLWSCKPSASSEDGLFAHIVHRHTTSSSTLQGRRIRFTRVAFSESSGRLAGCDQLGNVFIVALHHNRFSLLRRLGSPSTAMDFAGSGGAELYVALADNSVQCLNWKSGELVATLRGHSASVRHISMHSDGRFLLTTCSAEAILWDAKQHQRLRTLNGAQGVGVQQALFLPISNTLITCFKDDSIFAWSIDTLQYKYRLTVHDGPPPKFCAVTTSSDGRFLIAGGRSRFLHVWALDTRRLVRVIELPVAVCRVEQLFYIKDNCEGGVSQTIGVVCQDGVTRFLRSDTCRLLFELGASNGRALGSGGGRPQVEPITHASVSGDGHYVASIADSGALQLFSVETVCPQLSQPPVPLVQAVIPEKSRAKTKATTSSRPKPTGTFAMSTTSTSSSAARRSGAGEAADDTSELDGGALLLGSPSAAGTIGEQCRDMFEQPEAPGADQHVDITKLYDILRGYGRYPDKYRMFIWRSTLKLPENHAAYAALSNRGIHVAFQDLPEKYPVKSRKLLRQLQRTLSALAHWSPIFGEVTFLAPLIFPFVKLYSNNRLLAFEICTTLLLNFTQHWFDFHPHLPVGVLGMVETLLSHHDAGLLRHLTDHKVTSAEYAWPLLETMFSEVLTRGEWLEAMDNVLSNTADYLVFLVISYLVANRQTLLRCKALKDFEFFFRHRNAIDINRLVKEAYRLCDTTPADVHPRSEFKPFEPLTKGQYPVFSDYPKFVVDYQRQERDRIRHEELELLRERQATISAHQANVQRHRDEETFQRHQQMLNEAEQERRAQLEEEDRKLHEQRLRLLALKREVQAHDMAAVDGTRRRLMEQQTSQREAELQQLDEELERKARLRHEETELAVEAARVQATEMEMQKAMLEAEIRGQGHASHTALQHAWLQHEHEAALKVGSSCIEQAVLETRGKQQRQMFDAQQRLAKLQQLNSTQHAKDEMDFRARLNGLEQELEQLRVSRQQLANKSTADGLAHTLHQAELLERHHQREQQQAQSAQQKRSPKQGSKTARAAPLVPVNLADATLQDSELSMSSLPPSDLDAAMTSSLQRPSPLRTPHTPSRNEEQLLQEVTNLRRRVAKRLQDGSRSLLTSGSETNA